MAQDQGKLCLRARHPHQPLIPSSASDIAAASQPPRFGCWPALKANVCAQTCAGVEAGRLVYFQLQVGYQFEYRGCISSGVIPAKTNALPSFQELSSEQLFSERVTEACEISLQN